MTDAAVALDCQHTVQRVNGDLKAQKVKRGNVVQRRESLLLSNLQKFMEQQSQQQNKSGSFRFLVKRTTETRQMSVAAFGLA